MISADFVRMMSGYNRWQNESLYRAASTLPDAQRRAARGAFFGSIHGTLPHLLWGDTIWMSRFDAWDAPEIGIPDSPGWVSDWNDLKGRRAQADARICEWAASLTDGRLAGELSWFSGALQRDVTHSFALCVTHFFNHQTHHRGQEHAMLTAGGASPSDTDLFAMPEKRGSG